MTAGNDETTSARSASPRDGYGHHMEAAASALAAAIRTGAADGAETISRLLATVAANLGGMHTLTAARSGSWEADYVDRFLRAVVGDDGEYLLAHRTDPIVVTVSVEDALCEVWSCYDDSLDLITAAEDAAYPIPTPDATDEEGAAYEESIDRVARAERLVELLRRVDVASWQVAFERNVAKAAATLVSTKHLPAVIPVRVAWVAYEEALKPFVGWPLTVEDELYETAYMSTPIPGLEDVTPERCGDPVEALRTEGRLPHQRIPQLAHYEPEAAGAHEGGERA